MLLVKTWAEGIVGFNSLESEGAARGRELLKPITRGSHVLTIIYLT